MKKRIVSLFLAVLMVLSTSIVAVAADADLPIGAELRVALSGQTINKTSATATVSTATDAAFDFACTVDMTSVRAEANKYKELYAGTDLQAKLDEMKTTGEFTVTVVYDDMLDVPAVYTDDTKTMAGFADTAKAYYKETARTLVDNGNGTKTLTIKLATKDGGISVLELEADQALDNFTLTFEGVKANKFGSATVTGSMTGKSETSRGGSSKLVAAYASDPVSVTCTVRRPSSGGGSSVVVEDQKYTLTFDVDGDTAKIPAITAESGTVLNTAEFRVAYKEGYVFTGWYTDKNATNPVGETIKLNKNMTVYAGFEKTAPASDKLESTDHFAYVSGYPDGTVRPEANITREEAAMMFYRLLTKTYRETVESKTNDFGDVASERWSNDAISTLVNAGILKGYPEGDFRPGDYITRAEFATLVVNFDGVDETATHSFSDLKGHWSEPYVATAVKKGWIAGYDDGTFNPNGYITRAEAMTLVNRILYRYVNADGQHDDAVMWPDNATSAWYYYAVQEATNGHDYGRQENGVYENWTDLRK